MEESQAERLSELTTMSIRYMCIVNAPCRCTFSGTITYKDPDIFCKASSIFKPTKEMLTMHRVSLEEKQAVQKLLHVLNNCEIALQLIAHIESHSTEVKQFVAIATLLLKPLCKVFKPELV